MAISHLTDEEIQEFLDNPAFFANRKAHIGECVKCSESIKIYEMLIYGIRTQPIAQMPPDFSKRIASELMPRMVKDYSVWVDRIMLGGILVAASVALGVYFPRESLQSLVPQFVVPRSLAIPKSQALLLTMAGIVIVALYEFFDRKLLALKRN